MAAPGSPLNTTSTSSAVVTAPVVPVPSPLTPLHPKIPLNPVEFTAIAKPSQYESVSPSSPMSCKFTAFVDAVSISVDAPKEIWFDDGVPELIAVCSAVFLDAEFSYNDFGDAVISLPDAADTIIDGYGKLQNGRFAAGTELVANNDNTSIKCLIMILVSKDFV